MKAYLLMKDIKDEIKNASDTMDVKIIIDDDIEAVANISAQIDSKKYVVADIGCNKISDSKYVKYRSYFYKMSKNDQELLLKAAVKFLTNKK